MRRSAKVPIVLLVLCSIFPTTGCKYFSKFTPPIYQETQLILKENDFKMSAINLEGSATTWYLFYIVPLGDERLFSRALADLYRPIEQQVVGKPVQLMNWTYDDTTLGLFFVSRRKVLFRADLLEFTK